MSAEVMDTIMLWIALGALLITMTVLTVTYIRNKDFRDQVKVEIPKMIKQLREGCKKDFINTKGYFIAFGLVCVMYIATRLLLLFGFHIKSDTEICAFIKIICWIILFTIGISGMITLKIKERKLRKEID